MQIKICTKCGEAKSIGDFYRDSQKPSQLSPQCKSCKNTINKSWGEKNKETIAVIKNRWLLKNKEYRQIISLRSHLKRKYGLTIEEYEVLVEKQDGLCAICKKEDIISRLSIDHNHRTNKVRGLLCRNCNSLIGLAKESKEILLEAINYIEKQ